MREIVGVDSKIDQMEITFGLNSLSWVQTSGAWSLMCCFNKRKPILLNWLIKTWNQTGPTSNNFSNTIGTVLRGSGRWTVGMDYYSLLQR